MVSKLLVSLLLMAICVTIHAVGLITASRWIRHHALPAIETFRHATLLLIGVAAWTLSLHLVQILAWALFYEWHHAFPDVASSVYFSAVTYTTTGYGDLVLPREWRIVGGVEALTGILMCGFSTGFFYAVFSKSFNATD
jgi:hypothetical protein